ncbi:MAG: AAA family ATPase [Crocinitomicaceae bacterium]
MNKLFHQFREKISKMEVRYVRYLYNDIVWTDRLIALKGARGVGKTTLLYQHIKLNRALNDETLYVSLDDLYFQANTLVDMAEEFHLNGGKYLYLDEVHKYPNWSIEIKNLYDRYDDLHIVFTSSSLLEIYKGDADLSRRAVTYNLQGLSFREYLALQDVLDIPSFRLPDLLENHLAIAEKICSETKIIPHFRKYLESGYYPFYLEGETSYYGKIKSVINLTIESDIPSVFSTEFRTLQKIKKLLYVVATSLPYIPNIAKLSESLETTSRNSTLQYLDYLEKASMTKSLKTNAKGNNYLAKPDKIYLENTNMVYAIGDDRGNEGNIRETFFFNQLAAKNEVKTSKVSDFLVNEKYTFEVGGKGKTTTQIKEIDNAYIAADNIEIGFRNKIPLWLFGFLY